VAHGLDLTAVVAALERNTANVGAGFIEKSGEHYLIRVPGPARGIEDLGNIVVSTADEVALRVKDVAEVGLGRALRDGAATENGAEVVLGTVFMLRGENSRAVAAAVEARLQQINANLPTGITARTVYDRSVL